MRASRSSEDIFILKDEDVLIISRDIHLVLKCFMMCVNFLCAVARFMRLLVIGILSFLNYPSNMPKLTNNILDVHTCSILRKILSMSVMYT